MNARGLASHDASPTPGRASRSAALTAALAAAAAARRMNPSHDERAIITPKAVPPAATIALVTLATIASVMFLKWGSVFFVPVVVGVILAFLCNPIVKRLSRWGISRGVGAGLVILTLWGAGGMLGYGLQDGVVQFTEQLPKLAENVADRLESLNREGGRTLRNVRRAAVTLERAANVVTGEPPQPRSGLRVQMESSASRLSEFLWAGSASMLTFAAGVTVVSFLAFFLLASGENLKRKFIRSMGSGTLSDKKTGLRMVEALASRIQYTLLALVVTNILHGIGVGVAFHLMGVSHSGTWAVATALVHFVPYVGAVIIAVAALVAGLIQFDTVTGALMPALVSIIIAAIVGNVISVWLQSRTSAIDATSMFVGLLFWGWVWGPAGLLLGAPMMAMIKAVCDYVRPLHKLALLMQPIAPKPGARSLLKRLSGRPAAVAEVRPEVAVQQ